MHIHTQADIFFTINGELIEGVNDFTYHDSIKIMTSGADSDKENKITKAQ